MSTTPESAPESVDTTPPKRPFYRRTLMLFIAGAVVLVLIVGVLIAYVAGNATADSRLAAASSSAPTAHSTTEPQSKPTPTATTTPIPTATAAQPQASAPVAAAPPPAAPPPAAAAPVAPTNAGPGRTPPIAGVDITSFTSTIEDNCPNASTVNTTFAVTLSWSSTGGTSWIIVDHNANTTTSVGATGSRVYNQLCTAGGGQDIYYLTVQTNRVGANPAINTSTVHVVAEFTG